ncbi:hypothetical protein A7U43_27995 (plasmid) [Mycobacterium adipatum]|uniref:Uncharacterized protein n=1 Tax=Mycobacterium adipatum TaxID=1682113 RepID=A0A172UW63_9MYCO|nr:hypothetical protein A7U43_27995 [Mycobacterium adipatum]
MNRRKRPARYWHGLGPCLDPFSVRWIETAQMRGCAVRADASPECREYVYASGSREVALAFSVLGGGNAVCEISPGSLVAEVDPDFSTLGVRFRGPVRAVSVEVVEEAALPNARQIVKALAADYRWADSTRQYFEDGYLRAPPLSRSRGYVDEDFRWLGRWWPWHFLFPNGNGSEMVLDELGRSYLMFPPDFPGLNGRPRVPAGSLEHAWTRPGFYPNHMDWLWLYRQRVQAGGAVALAEIRLPWQW